MDEHNAVHEIKTEVELIIDEEIVTGVVQTFVVADFDIHPPVALFEQYAETWN